MAACTKEAVIELAQGLGFALVGVASARASGRGQYVRDWLASGRHGEMAYLAKNVAVRLDPGELLAGARSVICVADRYPSQPTDGGGAAFTDGACGVPIGRVARYAWGDDYHRVIKKRLHTLADALRDRWPGYEYRAAVDTAPVLEREHAVRAGLRWTGKHTLLINKRLGSWLLLGEIVTTLEIEAEGPRSGGVVAINHSRSEQSGCNSIEDEARSPTVAVGGVDGRNDRDSQGFECVLGEPDLETGHCGTCTRCIDACPTGCIEEAYRLDAARCISYLTIEHRGLIGADLHGAMGDWVAGCDVCQEVCPFNDVLRIDRLGGGPDRQGSGVVAGRYATRVPGPSVRLIEVLSWDVQTRQAVLRGSSLKRIKLDMMKRNALIAAGNYLIRHDEESLRAKVAALAADPGESELVRETARQVMERLERSGHISRVGESAS